MKIIKYSERSIAVIGEQTKQYKEQFKALGGKYNPNLSCGAGWIFSNKVASEVQSFLDHTHALKIASKDSNECVQEKIVNKQELQKELRECKELEKELSKKIKELEEKIKEL